MLGCSGDIWVPSDADAKAVPVEIKAAEPVKVKCEEPAKTEAAPEPAKTENVKPKEEPAKAVSPEKKPEEAKPTAEKKASKTKPSEKKLDLNKPYEEMSVEELQACILEKLAKNGPVTDRMRKEVAENIYPNSLLNWVKSFR